MSKYNYVDEADVALLKELADTQSATFKACRQLGKSATVTAHIRSAWNEAALRKPARKKRSATSETASVTAPLLSALNAIPGVHFTRINSGGYRGRSMGAPEGTPDLLGAVKGKAAAIETKAPGGKLSQAQRDWYIAHGHLYLYGVPCSVADGIELVKGWMR